ncbi:MAG: hypothetical protein ABIO19_01070 [Burkholderiaceae bacterium]
MAPATVHYDQAGKALREREKTLAHAFFLNPRRFKGCLPKPPELPTAVWIDPPQKKENFNPAIH